MFCIVCNAPAMTGNYCRKHFLEKHVLFSISNETVQYCRQCSAYTWKDRQFANEKDMIQKLSSGTRKTKYAISSCTHTAKHHGGKIHVTLACRGTIDSIEKKESHDFLIFVHKQLCLNCSRKSGGYYEAALQVRGEHAARIHKFIMRNMHSSGVTSMAETENGFDVRVIKKTDAAALSKMLKSEGYDVRTSYKLVKEKKGEKLYRNFYVIR